MRNETKRRDRISEMLKSNYNGRLSLAGMLKPRNQVSTWYCHECCEWFRQRADKLFDCRKTRCKCNSDHPFPANFKSPKQSGHCCLAFWETYEMVPPEQLLSDLRPLGASLRPLDLENGSEVRLGVSGA